MRYSEAISSGLASAIAGGSSTITAAQGAVSGSTTLTVQPATLVINTTALPTGVQNQPYSATLGATGGTAPYSWSLTNNTTLPVGLTLSAPGQINGTPTLAGTTTFTVQVKDGRRQVQDGPFANTKEQLGGFTVLECPSLDVALEWAARCPAAACGTVEVRPLAPEVRQRVTG